MLRVIGCITQQHDLWLVLLAALLCVFASITCVSMVSRTHVSEGHPRLLWLMAAGTVAGCGIWGTHFIGMLAFQPGFPVGYDQSLTALSAAAAVLLCIAGFQITLQKGYELAGGALTGAAISTMHYIGMAALRTPAIATWDMDYVVASVVIGAALSAVAMRVLLQRRSTTHLIEAGMLLTLAICGMHFTAMAAVTFTPNPEIDIPMAVLAPSTLALAVAAGAVLIVALGLTGVLVDNHLAWRSESEAETLRAHIQELESTKAQLENSTQNLAVALAQADAANRAKSQFVASMSHELRTPLNAVIGFSDMMLLETFGPLGHPRYRHYVQDIRICGASLLSLINNVLDLTKMDSGALALQNEELSIHDVIADVLGATANQAKLAEIVLTTDIQPRLPLINADRKRLRQVLTNLVGNAVKFTPKHGSVRLSAHCDRKELALAVSDTGIGIAPENIPKALDRFSQVDSSLARRYDGAGLGLPLARHLIELHGGRLEIHSVVNEGTTVTVFLPAERLIPSQEAA